MSSGITIRACTPEDWTAFEATLAMAFGTALSDEMRALWEPHTDPAKYLVAGDGDDVIGTAGWLPFDLTVPGGELPVAAVTAVTVRPTHRRRGILRQLMRRQLDDLHALGVPVAMLWASEPAIYQRFGYGMAYRKGRIDANARRCAFLRDPGPSGATRLLSAEQAQELLPPVYERARTAIPASLRRSALWWQTHKLADPTTGRGNASARYCVAWERDGVVEAYAIYRVEPGWGPDALPTHVLDVLEALGTTPTATREIWRYLFSVDLIATVRTHRLNADHPVFWMVEDPRQLRMTTADGTWLRLVDVGTALAARTYAATDSLAFELRDEFCPWNAGVWTVEGAPDGASARRTSAAPGLRLTAADLAAIFLGTVTCTALVRAGRVEELAAGAAARADALFRSDVAPWCLDDF